MVPRPSVLVILADDLGIGDLSVYSATADVATPAISQLAASGVRFTDAHAHPLCSPSRYSLLSGNYVFRGRYTSSAWSVFNRPQLLDNQRSLATAFCDAGYETLTAGKWGIGGSITGLPDSLKPFTARPAAIDWLLRNGRRLSDGPRQWGFNHSLTVPAGIQAPPFAWFGHGELQMAPGGRTRCWGVEAHTTPTGVSVTGNFGGQAMTREQRHFAQCGAAGDAAGAEPLHDGVDNWRSHMHDVHVVETVLAFWRRRRQRIPPAPPFFVLAATAAVHMPHTPRDHGWHDGTLRPHAAMVAELDATVRSLLTELRRDGTLSDTIVVFASDNGGLSCPEKQLGAWRPRPTAPTPDFGHPSLHCGPDSSGGLRGHKGDLYEGGHRVPMLVAWPGGGVPKGVDCSDLVGLTDLYATLLDLVDAPPLESGQAVDSMSFKRRLLAPSVGAPARRELLVPKNQAWALRHSHWKLIGTADVGRHRAEALFDLATDPAETKNLLNVSRPIGNASRNASRVADFFLARVRGLGAPLEARRPDLRST